MMVEWKFLSVDWLDARSDSKWVSIECLPEPIKVTTCGWLVKNEPDYIVIAASYQHSDKEVGELIAIPRGCILTLMEIGNGGENR